MLTRSLALICGLALTPAAFGQVPMRPTQPLEPAQQYQEDEEDEGAPSATIQVSPETLRSIQTTRPAPAQINTDSPTLRPVTRPNRPIRLPDMIDLGPAVSWHFSAAASDGSISETRATPEDGRSLVPVAALSRFRLSFSPGRDHKIRRMAVLAEERFARFSLADQDSNDWFRAGAQWAVISQGEQHEVSGYGGGAYRLPLEPGPEGHTAVLTGFDFQRQGGTDANVRTFGVWLEEDDVGAPVVRVTLFDDMGPDFRGLDETTLAAFGAAAIPFGALVGTTALAVDGISRFSASGGYRPFAVTIQYAWIPDSLVIREGAAAGDNGERGFPGASQVALQGFLFHFNNSDHHLLEVRVDPGSRVEYRDNDQDDPMRWEVQYVVLNDEMRG